MDNIYMNKGMVEYYRVSNKDKTNKNILPIKTSEIVTDNNLNDVLVDLCLDYLEDFLHCERKTYYFKIYGKNDYIWNAVKSVLELLNNSPIEFRMVNDLGSDTNTLYFDAPADKKAYYCYLIYLKNLYENNGKKRVRK